MFDRQEIQRAASEEVLRQMTAAVIVVEAPSGKILLVNREAQQWTEQVLGQHVPSELGEYRNLQESINFKMLHPDGRPYEMEEWPLTRSIRSGEEVRGEEIIHILDDSTQLWLRYDSSPIYDEEGRIVAGVAVVYDITERKRAEEQRAYHAHLLESIHDAVIATDEQFVITAWNKGAEQMFGWTADEALGRKVYELIPTDYSDEEMAQALRLLTETGRFRGEMIMYRKDGTPVHVEALTNALQEEEQGEITGYLNITRDITERKRAEEELRESRGRIENILESTTDAFFALDREWRFTYINERGLRQLQGGKGEELKREEVLGKNAWELYPELVGSEFYQKYHEAMREQKSVEFEAYAPLSERWYEVHVYPLEESLALYRRDITERKQAQKEIETRTHQQAVVAELGQRALAEPNLQLLMDEGVAVVARTLGVEYSEIVELLSDGEELLILAGVGWEEGIVGNTTVSAGFGSQAGYALLSEEPVIVEDLRTETRFSPPPVLLEHGTVSGMSVVIYGQEEPFGVLCADTTSRRTFTEDDVNFLQAVANVLATAIERKKAEEKIEEVREAERSRIARDLHDEALRDLTYALVEAQLLQSISKDPESTRRIGELIAALDRIGPQLRASIYNLRLEEERERTFFELLESLVELHREMAPDSNIRLDIRDGVLKEPLGERGREVLRIVGEALTNVRRHSRAQNVKVAVWSSEEKLWAEVSDDGQGFHPEKEPSATTGGMGIKGMRERARALGAGLKVESEPGRGTKVRLELALKKEHEKPEEEVRVLLVEDHATLREALASTFEREAGFNIVGQAGSLAEARQVLGAEPVDVAVVDLALPDGYGGDLIKELREASPQAQALVLSASLDRAQIARAVERGAAGVLHKTTHLDEVVEAVLRLRAGETLMPLEEVVELLRFASTQREEEYEAHQAIACLTPREREVLQALATGLDSEGIAERLHISLRTERNHMASILVKLGVHSQLQALVFALRHGVAEIP